MSPGGDEIDLNKQSINTRCTIQTGNNNNQGISHHSEQANSLNEERDAVNSDSIKHSNEEKNNDNAGTTCNADASDVDIANIDDDTFRDEKTNNVQDVDTINDEHAISVAEEERIKCTPEKNDNDNVVSSGGNCTNSKECKTDDDSNIAHVECVEDEHNDSRCAVLNTTGN